MAICDEAAINIDWQWNVNTVHEFQSSPVNAMQIYCYEFQLDAGTGKLTSRHAQSADMFMQSLKFGQRHNPHAQQTYDNCAAQQGLHSFAKSVLAAAPGVTSDFGEAKINTDWQLQNNPVSCRQALLFWRQVNNYPDQDVRNYLASSAGQNLMLGQTHNPDVLRLYRACFRDDPTRLFGLL